jgi:hypothetical protein
MRSTAKFGQEPQDSTDLYSSTPLNSTIPNLTSETTDSPERAQDAGKSAPSRPEIWLNRIFVAVFVLVCVQIGIMLVILPWTPVWTQNHFLLRNLSLREFALHDFVRGLISGLGLVNVWLGLWEGVHYREYHG